MTGIDTVDFAVAGPTTAAVSNISLVAADTYDVTISGGDLAGFKGTVSLDLAGGQDITDAVGNALPPDEPATDKTYLVVDFDFGDAPTASQSGFASTYPTTLLNDGTRHVINNLFLGQAVDADPDGQPDAAAGQDTTGGDDNSGAADEDGVFVAASIVAGSGVTTRSSFGITSSGTGKLDAWLDFNQNGDWDDSGEQIFTSVDVEAGVNLLSLDVPAGAIPGNTGARFRLSSAGGLAPTGEAPDGEVEDYIVTILDGDAAGGVAVRIEPGVPGTLDIVSDGDDVVLRSVAIELFRAPGSQLDRLNAIGNDGDDTLNVAKLDAIFSGMIGGDAGAGNDALRLTGSGQSLDLTQIADADIQGLETIDITGSGDNALTLNDEEVLNISPTTDTLVVRHNGGDIVNYGAGWTVDPPSLFNGEFRHVLQLGLAVIQVVNTTPSRNPFLPLDPNRNGEVSPVDALLPINSLNENGPRPLAAPPSVGTLPEFYLDANGDNFSSPIDALLVINFLNDPTGNAEGEAVLTHPDLVFVTAVASMPRGSVVDQHDKDASAAKGFATIVVGRVGQHEPPAQGKSFATGTEDADLLDAIDAFFGKFGFGLCDRETKHGASLVHRTLVIRQSDDTLVLFTSEQGVQFPGCKWTNWELGVHTAFVARWPGKVKPDSQTHAIIQCADVLPTLLDADDVQADSTHFV